MALRSNDSEVYAVLADGDRPSDSGDLLPFLQAANRIVDQDLAEAGLASAILKDAEKFLAAHLWAISRALPKGGLESSRIDDAEDRIRREGGLQATAYGQVAAALSQGRLQNLNRLKARFAVL